LARSVPEDIKKVIKKRKIDKGKNVVIIDKSGIKYLIYFFYKEIIIYN